MPGTRPKPWHAGHAPSGLLNENSCGVGSSNVIPSRSKRDEKSSISNGLAVARAP